MLMETCDDYEMEVHNMGLGTARGGRLFCKQDVQLGSIPSSSTLNNIIYAGLTQLGECFPYKEEVVGSSPTSCIVAVVQLVEHRVVVPNVVGSSPIGHLYRAFV